MDNTKIIEKLKEAFLDKNTECDGANCIGCWKDIVREAIKMLEVNQSTQETPDERYKKQWEEIHELNQQLKDLRAEKEELRKAHAEIYKLFEDWKSEAKKLLIENDELRKENEQLKSKI